MSWRWDWVLTAGGLAFLALGGLAADRVELFERVGEVESTGLAWVGESLRVIGFLLGLGAVVRLVVRLRRGVWK